MANHNFNFKDSYTEEEVWKAVDDGFDVRYEIWKKQYPDINQCRKRLFKFEEDYLKDKTGIGKIANSTDIPEKFSDFWIIYLHNDNDFSTKFDDINRDLIEEYQTAIKNGLEEYSNKIYYKEGNPNLIDLIQKKIEFNCKYLLDKKKYSDVVRHYVAFETAKERNDFDKGFQSILTYFVEELDNIYLGNTEGALKFLNKIKFDESVDIVTVDNFNKMWWNGDVSITRVVGDKIIQV